MNISPNGYCVGPACVRPGAAEHRCQCHRAKALTPEQIRHLGELERRIAELAATVRRMPAGGLAGNGR